LIEEWWASKRAVAENRAKYGAQKSKGRLWEPGQWIFLSF
jgi:hypothetical protein